MSYGDENAPAQRIAIWYTDGGGQWSTLSEHCGLAVIEVDNTDGQEAWRTAAEIDELMMAANEAGTMYPATEPEALAAALTRVVGEETPSAIPVCPECGAQNWKYSREVSGSFVWSITAEGWQEPEVEEGDVGDLGWWLTCRKCHSVWDWTNEGPAGEMLLDELRAAR